MISLAATAIAEPNAPEDHYMPDPLKNIRPA
jgi:hypothetical protein